MRIDSMSIYNLFMVLICITLMFSYIVLSCRKAVKKRSISLIKHTVIKAKKYFLNLTVKDYAVFEKYGIWRYVEQF